jgi:hypothetical protein
LCLSKSRRGRSLVDVDADSKSSRKSIRLKTVPSLGYSNQTYRLLESFASSRAMLAEVAILAGLPTSAGSSHLECSTYLDPLFDCTVLGVNQVASGFQFQG